MKRYITIKSFYMRYVLLWCEIRSKKQSGDIRHFYIDGPLVSEFYFTQIIGKIIQRGSIGDKQTGRSAENTK